MTFETQTEQSPPQPAAWIKAALFWCASMLCAAAVWYISSGTTAQALSGAAGFVLSIGLLSYSRTGGFQLAQVPAAALYAALFAVTRTPSIPVWEIPETLNEVFKISSFGSALFLLLYFALTATSLRGRGSRLSVMETFSLASIPFSFGWLLTLAAPVLPPTLTLPWTSIGASALVADLCGRATVLVLFNLLVISLLTALTARRWKLRVPLLGLAVASAAYAAVTPRIASLGVTAAMDWSIASQALVAFETIVVAQAGLWGQTFFATGVLMDALDRRQPGFARAKIHYTHGVFRGAMYSGVFMTLIQAARFFVSAPGVQEAAASHTPLFGALLGAILFPLIRTIVESFDGSEPFLRRLTRNHAGRLNYLRGAIVGVGISLALMWDLPSGSPWIRAGWGLLVGVLAYSGVNVARDLVEIARRHRQRLQPWNVYAVELGLGGFTGLALGWYAETSQLSVIIAKFYRYAALIMDPAESYEVYPLFSKWGAIDLGAVHNGARLLYNESVSGVIGWSLAAPLFAFNLVALTAILRRSARPIRELFTAAGFAKVISETLRVERWGLWMAPVIYTFLRMSAEPTWYNQDGAVRSTVAAVMSVALGDSEFHSWSLNLFASMLVLDWLRILIWFDHMGLRVATLVNLSFIGGDILDEKAARAMGHSAPSRVIPEGLRRFGTWMPLLIPFYIPRGGDWDFAWGAAEQAAASGNQGGITAAAFLCTVFAGTSTIIAARSRKTREVAETSTKESWARRTVRLSNGHYTLELAADGRGWSRVFRTPAGRDEIDLTRKPESPYATSGKALYLVERSATAGGSDAIWSLFRAPCNTADAIYTAVVHPKSVDYVCERDGIRSEVEASVHHEEHLEYWRIRLTNQSARRRELRLVSYRDLVLNGTGISQRHPSYNDLHVQTRFVPQLQAMFASNRLLQSKKGKPGKETFIHAFGPLPAQATLVGYRDARSHVLGRGSERFPEGLLSAARPLEDFGQLFSFEPVASLEVAVVLEPGMSVDLVVADGWARTLTAAAGRISRCLGTPRMDEQTLRATARRQRVLEYDLQPKGDRPWEFSQDGTTVTVGEDTPRVWSHPVANPLGYGFLATNEAALFSFSGNAQQNPVTPFVLGTQAGTTPGQAWYLRDIDTNEDLVQLPRRLHCGAPCHSSEFSSEFGRGYVTYRIAPAELHFELTAFVVPDSPAEGRLLQITNNSTRSRNLRLTSCFHIALAEVPNDSRSALQAAWRPGQQTFFFENPGQQFRRGPAFVAPGFPVESAETVLRHFIGRGRTLHSPIMSEAGRSEVGLSDDGYRVAAFSTVFELAPGETKQFSVTIGQAADVAECLRLAEALRTPALQADALAQAKAWWEEFLGVLRVETEDPGFDRLVNDWLPYQVVASRLWGRTGAYQRSGAFGFRDQLQDVMPLAVIHPEISRAQILLHAAQQFREGDTMQWWHTTWEGKTGIGARNKASDVMLWLPHIVNSYLQCTGDTAILDEQVPFLEGVKIPANQEGIVFAPRDTQDTGSLYDHCQRSIDWVLHSLGTHGIPKMGAGDWNDGLDKVGPHGVGESVWLGFFLHAVLSEFAPIAATRGDATSETRYREAADQLRRALDAMWRDNRYLRALMDDGSELLFDDALTSAWPIISGAADTSRGIAALAHGIDSLERETLMVLLAPAFSEHSQPNPGRIGVYPPGVRENGGQYSHGCSWLVDAAMDLAQLLEIEGDAAAAAEWRERGGRVWKKISPLSQTTDAQWVRYGLEPHQQPADIYYGPGYEGRGGWSWYSGSAGRMLSTAWKLLGIQCHAQQVELTDWAKTRQSWPKLKRVVYRDREV